MYIKVHLQSHIKRGGVHNHLVCLPFLFQGSDSTMSLDGHDKRCGFQNSMFPLCIYGAQDTFSSRIQFLRIWLSNNNPQIIGRFIWTTFLRASVIRHLQVHHIGYHRYHLANDFRLVEVLFYFKLTNWTYGYHPQLSLSTVC